MSKRIPKGETKAPYILACDLEQAISAWETKLGDILLEMGCIYDNNGFLYNGPDDWILADAFEVSIAALRRNVEHGNLRPGLKIGIM